VPPGHQENQDVWLALLFAEVEDEFDLTHGLVEPVGDLCGGVP